MNDLTTIETKWNQAKKVSFRFSFLFFGLFIFIQNNGAFPLWNVLMAYPTELLHQFIPWIGKNILQLPQDITVFTNGSGDTTYDYVIVFTIAMVSLFGSGLWSVLDRKRANYDTLYYWLTVFIRFYVGLMLINYGLVKVVKLQFPSPDIYRLTQIYGDSSPMGLAWTFLGFSKGYNLFMGLAEVAAVLLLFRRTMTLGSIITLMTTANVMAVNYFYDVPVKILSTALVTMTIFLLLKDAGRLWKFFLTDSSVELPVLSAPVIDKKWLRITKYVIKALIIVYALGFGLMNALEGRTLYGDQAPRPNLYGLYTVDTFVMNGDTIPPLLTDSVRWHQFVVEWEGYARVRHMQDSVSRFYANADTTAHAIELTYRDNATVKYSFVYQKEADRLNFIGVINEDSIEVYMKLKTVKDFRLINRGFHWINEYPFNR